MRLFYQKNIDLKQTNFVLNELDSKHAIKVLRLKTNSIIHIMDGIGNLIEGKIIDANSKKAMIEIINKTYFNNPNTPNLHIAIAPTKNMDRLEWFIEKAIEIGINEITPIFCENSERKVIKIERLEKIIISASKQALQYHTPTLNRPKGFKDFLSTVNSPNRYIAHCYDIIKAPLTKKSINKKTTILIGPEGDFSLKEVEKAINDFSFSSISLGDSRLRTETAGVIACHTFKLLNTIL